MEPEPTQAGDHERVVIVTARDEADRIEATIAAIRAALPGARVVLAESGSRDATAELAEAAGAETVRTESPRRGKGRSTTTAARAALAARGAESATFLLCDGDLGESAARLVPLVDAVEAGQCDLAVAAFARRLGGGFGIAASPASRRRRRSRASGRSVAPRSSASSRSRTASGWRRA
jgi:glycosyltransferase involved in cell wall biosynthesis